MRMTIWGLSGVVASALLTLAACDGSPEAPTNVGVCWRLATGADGKATFAPVSTTARNLETCGAHLEAVSLRENRPTLTGAYQGQFLFITPAMVQTGQRLHGSRYRLFDADTRAKVDKDLKWMLDDEKHPSAFGPQGAAAAK